MNVIRRLRKERGLTQRELAEKAGTTQYTVSEIELGRRDPHPTTLRKLAEALGVSVAEFFAQEPAGPKVPAPPQPEDAAMVGLEDHDDRLLMRQEYERAFSGANEKLRSDLASVDITDPQNLDTLYALFTLASMTSMNARVLTESEAFMQEVEGESVPERRARRGVLEAVDSLSETADAVREVIEDLDEQVESRSNLVSMEEARRKRSSKRAS